MRRRALLVAAALGAGVGAYWSVRLAWAEVLYERGTEASVQSAAGLAPGNAEYGRRRAELVEAAEPNPGKAEEALAAVLREKPGDSQTLIALGLHAELRNDFAAAERDLLEAARHDRGYDPRWSLANYYSRRRDGKDFEKWARAACEMAYEPAPLFRLLWNYWEDAGEILDRGIPNQPGILRQYLTFLTGGSHWEAADGVAKRILERPVVEDTPALMAYCDRLLDARRGQDALEVWNALARGGLIGLGKADSERGPVDGGFRTAPSGSGFDWRLAPVEGIEASQDEPGLRLSFSGEEPEECEPLWQYVALKAGARYKMTFEYAASGVAEGSGLRWRVLDITGKPAAIAESENLTKEGWTNGSVFFTTPPGMLLGRLALSYRRAPGKTRIEGSIRLRNVALGRAN
jgi:hypothetical protein